MCAYRTQLFSAGSSAVAAGEYLSVFLVTIHVYVYQVDLVNHLKIDWLDSILGA